MQSSSKPVPTRHSKIYDFAARTARPARNVRPITFESVAAVVPSVIAVTVAVVVGDFGCCIHASSRTAASRCMASSTIAAIDRLGLVADDSTWRPTSASEK
jgi:precorrin-6B methylase 2